MNEVSVPGTPLKNTRINQNLQGIDNLLPIAGLYKYLSPGAQQFLVTAVR